jgi:peptide/nickel transport system ATP-binding protein/oligopeptide transport system ATP-binding protein
VELGTTEDVMDRPQHPYTQALIAAAPVPDPALAVRRTSRVITEQFPGPFAEVPPERWRAE